MKIGKILIALAAFTLPLLATYIWYYQGTYQPTKAADIPDYASLFIPQPTVSTLVPQSTEQPKTNGTILVDFSHGNNFSIQEIEALSNTLTNQGMKVELYDGSNDLEQPLKYVNAFIVIAPTTSYSETEKRVVKKFLERGGRMLVIVDPTRDNLGSSSGILGNSGGGTSNSGVLDGIDIANQLLSPYHIAFLRDYVYNMSENEGNFRNVIFKKFPQNPITEKLNQIVLYGSHSIKTNQVALIQGSDFTLSSLTDKGGNLAVAATDDKGKVLAIGDLTFMSIPYYQVADNQQLLSNIGKFLVGGKQDATLENLPYVFTRPVSILIEKDSSIDNKNLSTLSDIQKAIKQLGLPIKLAEKPEKDTDLLILDVIPPEKDIQSYLDPFKIKFSTQKEKKSIEIKLTPTFTPSPTPSHTPETIIEEGAEKSAQSNKTVIVPDLGEFNTNGIGLAMLSSTAERNTLILLTDSEDDLSTFVSNILDFGDLTGCIVKENIAVCKLSEGDGGDNTDSNSDSESNFDAEPPFDTFESTPTSTGNEKPKTTPIPVKN